MITDAELPKEIGGLRDTINKELTDRNSLIITELKNDISNTTSECFTSLTTEGHEIKASMAFINQTFEDVKLNCESVLKRTANF